MGESITQRRIGEAIDEKSMLIGVNVNITHLVNREQTILGAVVGIPPTIAFQN
jgi:hypothetical protein